MPAADNEQHVAGTWDGELVDDLREDLETGLLVRLVKTRHGNVLRAAPDGPERYLDDRRFYISAALEYVGHLDEAVGHGTGTARPPCRPAAQLVDGIRKQPRRRTSTRHTWSCPAEAAIEHVQLLPGTSDLVATPSPPVGHPMSTTV